MNQETKLIKSRLGLLRLAEHGESIYETEGGSYIPNGTVASTRKENKIYLHILKRESTEIKLPAILKLKMTKAYFLNGDAVTFVQNENNIILDLPEKLPNEDCSVVVLEFDDDTENIPLMKIDMD